jgi:hypothetical protein
MAEISTFIATPIPVPDDKLQELRSVSLSVLEENTPVDTGLLVSSWSVEPQRDGVRVSNSAPYAEFVDKGTRFMAPRNMTGALENFLNANAVGLFSVEDEIDEIFKNINLDEPLDEIDRLADQLARSILGTGVRREVETQRPFRSGTLRTVIRESGQRRTDDAFDRARPTVPGARQQGTLPGRQEITGEDIGVIFRTPTIGGSDSAVNEILNSIKNN